jgi:hypothetical protein
VAFDDRHDPIHHRRPAAGKATMSDTEYHQITTTLSGDWPVSHPRIKPAEILLTFSFGFVAGTAVQLILWWLL